jgi:glycosyltransferase involved in cell wall biosynthesis
MNVPITLDDIGVVAIGRNEGERLIRCIESLKSVAGNIVYVDSGSTDGSVAAAEQSGAFVVELDLAQPFTAARARNEGFAAVKALSPNIRFVQFVDGDCILVSGWLEKAIAFIEQRKDVAIVCGRRRERYPEASMYNELCDIEWNTPIGEVPACGGDALVRVEAFEVVSGFRPQVLAGEEPELCARLREIGWKIWRLDAEMTLHDAAMSRFGQWWVRSVRSGYGLAQVSQLQKGSALPLWRREIASVVFWAGIVPTAIGFGFLASPLALWGALIYPIQIFRIAFRHGIQSCGWWRYASFMTLVKFAHLQGILNFYWSRWRRQAVYLIEYKE